MISRARKLYSWASQKAQDRFAAVWLGCVFLMELVLFVPLDAILALFCLENPSRRYLYASVATAASLITASAGYLLGALAWDAIGPFLLKHLMSADFFQRVCQHYQAYQNGAVFLGSLLPLPFKAVTLSAGVCNLSFAAFLGAVFCARSLRFFFIAKATHKWGDKIKNFIDRHFGRLVVAVGAKIAAGLAFFWALAQ